MNLQCPSPISTGFDPPRSIRVQLLIPYSPQEVLLYLKDITMFLQYLAVSRDYLYGTCSSLSCRHMSTGLLENLSTVSKWIEVPTSVWLLRVAWRKGASSSAWKSMVRLPLREREPHGLVTEQWPCAGHHALATQNPINILIFSLAMEKLCNQHLPESYPICLPGRAGPSRRTVEGCGKPG